MPQPKKLDKDDIHAKACHWLAEWNELKESGRASQKRLDTAWRKAQYWLDRLTKIEGGWTA